MKEFLIVKTSAIGDVLQSFHLIDYLTKRFPKCKIDWVVEKQIAPLMRAHPHIEKVLEVDTRKWRHNFYANRKEIHAFIKELRKKNYEALFDLQGNIKSGFITSFAKAQRKVGFSWEALPEKLNFLSTNVHLYVDQKNVRSRYLRLVQDFFGDDEEVELEPIKLHLTKEEEVRLQRLEQLCFQRPRLMVCFGSNWPNKMLSEKTLTAFLHKIDEKFSPSFFFIFKSDAEKRLADKLERSFSRCSHSVGEMSLPLWQRFMHLVEGVISTDSAALHLCATTTTPSFSIFGPSSAEAYKPSGKKHFAFQGSCPYDIRFEKRCPHLRTCETGSCMRDISEVALFEQFELFWEKVSDKQLVLC